MATVPASVRGANASGGPALEAELTASNAPSAHPSSVTTIGLDGGYVRHCDAELGTNFEIIAGRVLAEDGLQRSVGFVRTVDEHSRTRVQQAVAELGGADDSLRIFTDGDGALRDLQLSVLPEATHVLNWYHLTRRLTVLASVINGKEAAEKLPARDQDRLSDWMDSAKWRLWHGRASGAITRLQSMLSAMARHSAPGEAVVKRLTKLTTEFLQSPRRAFKASNSGVTQIAEDPTLLRSTSIEIHGTERPAGEKHSTSLGAATAATAFSAMNSIVGFWPSWYRVRSKSAIP